MLYSSASKSTTSSSGYKKTTGRVKMPHQCSCLNVPTHGVSPRLLALSCAAAIATFASPALLAKNTSEQRAIEEIMVTSSTRRPESLANVNASVGVLSQEELTLVSHQHIQEVANRLAGVNINRNNGQESLTAIRSPVLTGSGAVAPSCSPNKAFPCVPPVSVTSTNCSTPTPRMPHASK